MFSSDVVIRFLTVGGVVSAMDITVTVSTPVSAFQDEQKKITDIQRSWSTFEMRIPAMIAEMKREFRRLMGGSNKWF